MAKRPPIQHRFAQVALPLPVLQDFTYAVPEHLGVLAVPGSRVLVPFGSRHLTGYVVALQASSEVEGVKDVLDVLDPAPLLDGEMLALTKWVAEYYVCSWGEAIKSALPAGIDQESRRTVSLGRTADPASLERMARRAPRQAAILRMLAEKGCMRLPALEAAFGVASLRSSLHDLAEHGHIVLCDGLPRPRVRVKKARVIFCRLDDLAALDSAVQELARRAPKQAACLAAFAEGPGEIPAALLSKRQGVGGETVRRLIEKGLLGERFREVRRDPFEDLVVEPPKALTLTAAQKETLDRIADAVERQVFYPLLLLGVTGSGKTEIYLRAIAQALKRGRGAIVLVPEISLTPQTVRRFKAVFGDQVAVLHSRLSLGERYDTWRSIREGRGRIVVGARSAIFAPVGRLGVIVVDEEHDTSYKQQGGSPRYNARDVAAVRAKMSGAVVIFGSATPSLESYHNALTGKFHLAELPARVSVSGAQAEHPMPDVTVVDMRQEIKRGNRSLFSLLLRRRIQERLGRKERIILLQNRRGYAPFVQCVDCGFVPGCPNCQVSLTYHALGHWMVCHYCGARRKAPSACPSCEGANLRYMGTGTQKVEEALNAEFPEARVIRMDVDTTRRKHAHDRLLQAFGKGEADFLLGTQMVAKGLDFPGVGLVGVISADTGLFFPDFRAGERTFQLLTQVAGRAGRGDVHGEVVIQTFCPDNPAIGFAQRHDFRAFARAELEERAELNYPPWGKLICVLFSGEDEEAVSWAAGQYARELQLCGLGGVEVLGPAEAPLARIRKQFRWQVVLKGAASGAMRRLACSAAAQLAPQVSGRGVKVSLDVDPMDML